MKINEQIILDHLSQIKQTLANKNILDVIGKIICKDSDVFFAINADKDLLKEAESLRTSCINHLSKIPEIGDIKISITSNKTQKPSKTINGVKNTIVVASGKGGVGKSTIAVNLAISLSNLGKKVAIVDLDIHGPSIPKMLGVMSKPSVVNNLMIPLQAYGISIMSIGFLLPPEEVAIWRGPMTTKALHQLIKMTDWRAHTKSDIDYLVIDTPPGTGDIHLTLAENYKIDNAIIVSTPQEIAIMDAIKSILMYNKLGIKIGAIIENMSYILTPSGEKQYIFGKGYVKKASKKYNIKLLAEIPIDAAISISGDKGKPISYVNRENIASLVFKKIAESYL